MKGWIDFSPREWVTLGRIEESAPFTCTKTRLVFLSLTMTDMAFLSDSKGNVRTSSQSSGYPDTWFLSTILSESGFFKNSMTLAVLLMSSKQHSSIEGPLYINPFTLYSSSTEIQSWLRVMHLKKSYSCSLSVKSLVMAPNSKQFVVNEVLYPQGKAIDLKTNSFFVSVPVLSQNKYST